MTGIYVNVPIACFRKGMAREYLETELIPPPSTCYGFLLSLVGETKRSRHLGAKVTVALHGHAPVSTVLRTLWRVKSLPKDNIQPGGNARPDFQQLLTNLDLVIWVDSAAEISDPTFLTLEERVSEALDPATRGQISRFGGLCLGESTHLVNDVSPWSRKRDQLPAEGWQLFQHQPQGSMTLPVWVDHVGSAKTVHSNGSMMPWDVHAAPAAEDLHLITSSKAAAETLRL